MEIIDIKKLHDLSFHVTPYKYAEINNIFHNNISAQLCKEYPKTGFNFCEMLNNDKTYSMFMRQLFDSRKSQNILSDGLTNLWQYYLKELLSSEYISIMSQHMQRDLSKVDIEINCWIYTNGCWLSPHTDKKTKIVSQLFYFNEIWNKHWGGGFRVLKSDNNEDIHHEIFPDVSTSIVLVRSDNSWHSVSPLSSPEDIKRQLLQIIFWEKI